MSTLRLGIRRAVNLAPSSPSFICTRCKQQNPSRSKTTQLKHLVSTRFYATARQETPMGSLADKLAGIRKSSSETWKPAAADGAKTAWSWPKNNSKTVGYWLLGSAASVFGIVVLGGLTRLTESGLSITEWRPVTGTLPPLSASDWQSEFDKYRASPEYAVLNPHMDLSAFKKIYLMEWAHRLWGRAIGLGFAVPAVYFIARRRVTPRMAGMLGLLTGLIGAQGALGWWMVKSGLKDDLFAPGSHPRVSQYRLAAHLGTAFACYSGMLLAGLGVLRENRLLSTPSAAARSALQALADPRLGPLRLATAALTGLVGITVLSGALVAGLDAGLIYNEYPRMGTGFAPPASELWDARYARRADGADKWWRNMLENPTLVQLEHRILTAATVCAVLGVWAVSRRAGVRAVLPREPRTAVRALLGLVGVQFCLGYFTLVYMVPTPLAAAHQAGALALLTGALVLGHRLRVPRGTMALLQKRLAQTRGGRK